MTLASPITKPVSLPVMRRSEPYKIIIKKISMWVMIDKIGLRRDGRVETPPYETADRASWYRHSVTPGENGPSVIFGHVDSKDRIAAFFYLSKIRPGNEIEVVRADRSSALFTVDSVEQFPKNNFPTARVYGPTDGATLRLVTCGGKYNTATQSYADNIIVFAHLSGVRPSPAPR